jgi:methyl-accepting chemotaxis protein
MDEVTQQNSALVEENAATAKTLEHQAKAMDDQVAYFRIGGGDASDDEEVPPANAHDKGRSSARDSRKPVADTKKGEAAAA